MHARTHAQTLLLLLLLLPHKRVCAFTHLAAIHSGVSPSRVLNVALALALSSTSHTGSRLYLGVAFPFIQPNVCGYSGGTFDSIQIN